MQFYSKNSEIKSKEPKKETIQFLLNYSKSLKIIQTKSKCFIELNLN